jgi:uncharacterized membrane-anchored protein
MNQTVEQPLSKTAEVTLIFWIIKIAATILDKTGGDAVTTSIHLGYLAGTAVFAAISARRKSKLRVIIRFCVK